MRSAPVRRLVCAHLLAVVGEWAATIAVLVAAYDWGGTRALGLSSLAVLAAGLLGAPMAAHVAARFRVHRVRVGGFAVQAVALAGASTAAALRAPAPVVVAFVVVALAALSTLRPTGAVLLPAVVRSTRELVAGNLWVAHCDSSSALVGPLAAAALLGLGGPVAVLVACCAASALACALTAWRAAPAVRALATHTAGESSRAALPGALTEIRQARWTIGVLGASAARNIVIGALDVLLVIIAIDALDMGPGGPGVLSMLVGAGALLSTALLAFVVRRSQLRHAIGGSIVAAAVVCLLLAARTEAVRVLVLLVPLGAALALTDTSSRILLQRSTDPRRLGPLFAVLGMVASAGQIAGSLVAQVSFVRGGLAVALAAVGGLTAVLAVAIAPMLRAADAHADVPVVEMALLARVGWLAELPVPALEAVARSAEARTVAAGCEVVTQGDSGDEFYVVADGEFDVVMSGEHIRRAMRGDFFGEVALLADVARTATVTACRAGELLVIQRAAFLDAIGGHQASFTQATAHVRSLRLEPGMLPADPLDPA